MLYLPHARFLLRDASARQGRSRHEDTKLNRCIPIRIIIETFVPQCLGVSFMHH